MRAKLLLFLFLGAIHWMVAASVRSQVNSKSLRKRAVSASTLRLPSSETALVQLNPALTTENGHPHLVRRTSNEEFWRERDRKARQERIRQRAAHKVAERARSTHREDSLYRTIGKEVSVRHQELWKEREKEAAALESEGLSRYDDCWAYQAASPPIGSIKILLFSCLIAL